MKAYCRICGLIQPSSFRPCNDAATGALYEDLCCDTCDFIVATVEERETLAQPAQETVARVLQIIKELRPAIKPLEVMGKGKTTDEWFDILVKEIEQAFKEKNT